MHTHIIFLRADAQAHTHTCERVYKHARVFPFNEATPDIKNTWILTSQHKMFLSREGIHPPSSSWMALFL